MVFYFEEILHWFYTSLPNLCVILQFFIVTSNRLGDCKWRVRIFQIIMELHQTFSMMNLSPLKTI